MAVRELRGYPGYYRPSHFAYCLGEGLSVRGNSDYGCQGDKRVSWLVFKVIILLPDFIRSITLITSMQTFTDN